MDLLCCHKGRTVSGRQRRSVARAEKQRRQCEEKKEEEEEAELNVTLRILKADLPQNGNLFGASNLYAVARWEGDTSLCEWEVASTPTLWLDAVAPEWDYGCPRQPNGAFVGGRGASVVFEVWQDAYTFFGSTERLGEAAVPAANLLEGLGRGDLAERDFILWRDDEDAGTLTVQVFVEPPPAQEAPAAATQLQRAVRVQRALLAPPRRSVAIARSPSPSAKSSSAGSGDEHEKEQPPSTRSRDQHTSPRMPCKQRANTLINVRCRASSSSSSSSSRSEAGDSSPAQKVASAMWSHWDMNSKKAIRKSRSEHFDNKPWRVDRQPAETVNPELQALKILQSVKAGGPDKLKLMQAVGVGRLKSPMPPLDEASAMKALIKRLRVTAKKFPRNGIGLVALSKERFFAITKADQTQAAGKKSSAISGPLHLSWFEDEAAWRRRARPLGYIRLASICGSSVDQQSVGFVVTIKFVEDEEDGPGVEPECLSVIFGSLLAAEEWNTDLNELLELTCRR